MIIAMIGAVVAAAGTAVAWANNIMDWLNTVAPLGSFWYVLVFLGLALCILLVMFLAMLLAALGVYVFGRWRSSSLAAEAGASNSSGDVPASDEERNEAFTKIDDVHTEQALYVGQIMLYAGRAGEHLLGISLWCFNGSRNKVDVLAVRGNILAEMRSAGRVERDFGPLQTPHIDSDITNATKIGPSSEFSLSLWQHVPDEMVKHLECTDDESAICFDFEGLDIRIAVSDNHAVSERLPLWGGVLFKHTGELCTVRNHIIRRKVA